ncbi:MAG: FUSC family protein [Terriglobales bacterium]
MLRKFPAGNKAGHNLRNALQRVSFAALWRALRCATSTGIPALLGATTGNHEFGWAALGGFEATLAELGGSYQARFVAMGLLSVGGAFGLFLGTISSGHLWSVFLCTVIWSFLWAYASVLGGTVNAFNALVVVIFLCGIETHVQSWTQAAHHALYLLGGAAWATTLSLLVWPIHPYRPARVAVGKCYESLAELLSTTLQLLRRESGDPKLWHRAARSHQYAIRNLLEEARAIIAATRAQQLTENVRGEQLLVLLETADVMLGYAIAATERAEQVQTQAQQRDFLIEFLEKWRESLLWVHRTATRDRIPPAAARDQQRGEMRHVASLANACGDPLITHLAHMTADAMDVAIAAVFTARTDVAVPTGSAVPIGPSHRTISLPTRSMWQTLREAWSWDSVTLRHALRVSVVCGAGILIAASMHLQHGYWIPMTSVIVMRPHLAATWTRSLERTLGSAAGGALAAVLIFFVRSKLTLALLLFPLSFATLVLLPVSYALFVFFLTPTFAIASISNVGDWHLAAVRAMDTTLGAALALPAMYGLWPLWQHESFRERLASNFQADVNYFSTLERSWRDPDSISPVEIARARRQGRTLKQCSRGGTRSTIGRTQDGS